MEWEINLHKGKGPLAVVYHGCICRVLLKVFTLHYVANFVHEVKNKTQKNSYVIVFSKFGKHSFSCLFFNFEMVCLSESITVPELAIFNPESVEHAITLEPLVTTCS